MTQLKNTGISPKHILIPEDFANIRLDRLLRKLFPDLPLSGIYKLLRRKKITVNGETAAPGYRLQPRDSIHYPGDLSARDLSGPGPVESPFPILFSDDSLLVISKPRGISVQPGTGSLRSIVTTFRKEHGLFSPSPVHRLDKDTSGVLVIALKRQSAVRLSEIFRKGKARKYYIARVTGQYPAGLKVLREKIGDKKAVTLVSPLQRKKAYSYLLLRPVSGRKHQIRIHLSLAGHPVCGDKKYLPATTKEIDPFLHLHAFSLSFPHPLSTTEVEIYDETADWIPGNILHKARQLIIRET